MKRIEVIDNKITCKKCNCVKHKLLFTRRSGTDLYRGVCVACSQNFTSEQIIKESKFLELFLDNKKECLMCGSIKPLDNFDQDKSCRFGLKSTCRNCRSSTVKELSRKAYLKFNYKLSLDAYNQLLLSQHNLCAICNIDLLSLDVKEINIDHCHTTGKVRGVLCRQCNLGLGHFKDDLISLNNAINYLIKIQ